jgi:hypothetical protein
MKKYLVFISIIIAFAACKKHDDKEYVPLNTQLKNSYSFKEGSYWIYRDSLSGRTDSFYVTNYSNYNSTNTLYSEEVVAVEITQYNIGTQVSDSSHWMLVLKTGSTIDLEGYCWPLNKGFVNNDISSDYPFINTTGVIVFPTYSIQNISYSNVAAIFYCPGISSTNSSLIYLKDSIGIVKNCLNFDTLHYAWLLQRYHINF